VPLLIAGSGPAGQEDQLRRLVHRSGLTDNVRLLGRVDDRAKTELLRQAVLLVMPSRFEASPLVLIEAFCHRVPAVLFDLPELGDMPAACCVKVPAFDTPAFAEAVLSLQADAPRRLALGQAAKTFARRFNWDDLARQYADFFDTLLASTHHECTAPDH
jgi:glycosyltransferase involved in cell wall biosynthesis